jgi:Capsule assembly protein Wzi
MEPGARPASGSLVKGQRILRPATMGARRVAAALALLAVALLAVTLSAFPAGAADLFLNGEQELYVAVDKLNAMGAFPGFLANTRPYSVAAIRAALAGNPAAFRGDGFDADLARWLSYSVGDSLMARGTVGVEGSEKRETREDQGGIPTPRGISGRWSVLARETTSQHVSAHAAATWFFGKDGDFGTRVGETALEVGLPYASLQFGKLTTWYGPGRRGALLFTNNAQSYPGVRLHNPVPIAVPGFFSFLGNVQYDLFLARLEGTHEPVHHPILSGVRLALRPSRYFELGASRAMEFGGEGRDESLSAYLDLLTGRRESAGNTPIGNSLASVDGTVYLPFPVQPAELYVEWGGEDQSQPFVFTRHAWLGGLYLPTIGPFRRADLRFEFGSTLTADPGVWYRHPDYPYTFHDRILGHPMGTDAKELSVQGRYFLSPSAYAELTLTRTDRYATGGDPKERTDRVAAGIVGWLSANVRVEGEVAWENVHSEAHVPGAGSADTSFRLALSYQLRRGRLETR